MAKLTPMMQQYMRVKDEHKDSIVFYRLGDFYEMFFEDAEIAAKELELVLTGRDCGLETRAPMCGVPHHSAEGYIKKLIDRGYKVAICEQLTDPADAKGLVERGVVRIITPGTVTDAQMLDDRQSNFICSLFLRSGHAALAYCDVSTGELYAVFLEDPEKIRDEIARIAPREVLYDSSQGGIAYMPPGIALSDQEGGRFDYAQALDAVMRRFPESQWTHISQNARECVLPAVGALLQYLENTQKNPLSHIGSFTLRDERKYMGLDRFTRRNLELTQSLRDGGKRGSLLSHLDYTSTPMGARLLRGWIEEPLQDLEAINARLDGVEALQEDILLQSEVAARLGKMYDIERLLSRIAAGTVNARDCLSLMATLREVPGLKAVLADAGKSRLAAIAGELDPIDELVALIEQAIAPDAPVSVKEGGLIREGYNAELDELREIARGGKQWIAALEAEEREKTGIRTLKVGYNRVFGYYIEVTRAHSSEVPYYFERKQTLANAERYFTPELKEMEEKILGAEDESMRLEYVLFEKMREALSGALQRIRTTALGLKTLDALNALAAVSIEYNYVRPQMTGGGVLEIKAGRHPIVEKNLSDNFVANDCVLDEEDHRIMIITGPNMAGKSTYMRQVALIVLMAHIGSFVPASAATIPLTDQIFTRVGASDDLASGQSTFMVEMSETAYILRNATSRSLIIVDEIGRGTATFDGLSIAWAVVEYIASGKVGAKTLFATHYHELSELEGHLKGIANYRITVREHGENVIFLHKIARGSADKSFGIQVARIAGVPEHVLRRSMEIMAKLENSDITQTTLGRHLLSDEGAEENDKQLDLFSYPAQELIDSIKALDVMAMTPMDALNALFQLREKAKDL